MQYKVILAFLLILLGVILGFLASVLTPLISLPWIKDNIWVLIVSMVIVLLFSIWVLDTQNAIAEADLITLKEKIRADIRRELDADREIDSLHKAKTDLTSPELKVRQDALGKLLEARNSHPEVRKWLNDALNYNLLAVRSLVAIALAKEGNKQAIEVLTQVMIDTKEIINRNNGDDEIWMSIFTYLAHANKLRESILRDTRSHWSFLRTDSDFYTRYGYKQSFINDERRRTISDVLQKFITEELSRELDSLRWK